MTLAISCKRCKHCGYCAEMAPTVFEMAEDNYPHVIRRYDDSKLTKQIIQDCPGGAIVAYS